MNVNDSYTLGGNTWKVSKVMPDGSVRSIKQLNGKGCKGKPRKHTAEQLENALPLQTQEMVQTEVVTEE